MNLNRANVQAQPKPLPWFCTAFQSHLVDNFLKRGIDIFLALLALTISFPVLVLCVAAIALGSQGSIIDSEERVTQGGRVFKLYKLRTTRVDGAKHALPSLDEDEERLTKVGYWLRRARLDEIPQLVNILKGDLCVVVPKSGSRQSWLEVVAED